MNPKKIMLGSQSQEATYCMIPFTENVQSRKIKRHKNRDFRDYLLVLLIHTCLGGIKEMKKLGNDCTIL